MSNNYTYNLMKRIIERGGFDKEDTLQKLDAFLAASRLTTKEYNELVKMIGGEKNG